MAIKKIGIDYDGTLARTQDVVTLLMNFKHNTSYTTKDIRDWYFWESKGLADDFWKIYDLFDNTALRRAILPYDSYVAPTVQQLAEKYDLTILTANDPKCVKPIQNWAAANLHIHVPVIAIGRGPSARKLDGSFDLLIDDSPELASTESTIPRILMNTKWNEHVPDSFYVIRNRSWLEVPKTIEIFEKRTM